MTAETLTVPSLRDVLLEALDDAYFYRRGEIDGCGDCPKQPARICADHRADNDAAREYEEARKQIERTPGNPEVLAVFAGLNGEAS